MKLAILETSYSGRIVKPFINELKKHVKIDVLLVEDSLNNHFALNELSPLLLTKNKATAHYDAKSLKRHITQLSELLNIPSFRPLFVADQTYKTKNVYAKYNKHEIARRLIRYYDIFSDYLDRVKPDFVLQHLGAELERRLLRMLCDNRGIPSIIFDYVPFYKGFQPSKNEYSDLYNIPLRVIPDDMVEDYFDQYLSGEATYFQVKQSSVSVADRIRRFAVDPERFDHFGGFVKGKLKSKYLTYRKNLETNYVKHLKRQLPKNKRLFLFPLQTNEESTITVRSNGFCDQFQLIKMLSLCLPDDCALIVKFHPHYLKGIPLREMRDIGKLQDVYLMESSFRMCEALPMVDAVVTVNSTVGFEAIMMGKPVMLLGTAIYGGHGLTVDARTPNDWPYLMKELINHRPQKAVVAGMVKKWLACAFRGLYNDDTIYLVEDLLLFCTRCKEQNKLL